MKLGQPIVGYLALLGPLAEGRGGPYSNEHCFFPRTLFPAAGQIPAYEPIELKFGTPLEEAFCSSDAKNLSNRMLTG